MQKGKEFIFLSASFFKIINILYFCIQISAVSVRMRVKICVCSHNLAHSSLRSFGSCPNGHGGNLSRTPALKNAMKEVNKQKRENPKAVSTIADTIVIKKEEFLKFRVTYWEKLTIQEKASNAGLKTSDYIRRAALDKTIPSLMTAEQVEAYKILKNLEVKFKRIGNMYHDKNLRNYEELSREVSEVVKQVQEHLKAIKNGKQS